MIVGGRDFHWSREQVKAAMSGVEPEEIRRNVVEIGDQQFPPKQVLTVVTGWERQSFTTHEAQRVLSKLGFPCRPPGVRYTCLLYTSPSPRDGLLSRMPSSA